MNNRYCHKINKEVFNLEDFAPYNEEGKLSSSHGSRRMINKHTGEIVYFKPLHFAEFVKEQLVHALFPNHTSTCGIAFSTDESGEKQYYLYSKSFLNEGNDTSEFLNSYAARIPTLRESKNAIVNGLEKILTINILCDEGDFHNDNIVVHNNKAYRIDFDHSFNIDMRLPEKDSIFFILQALQFNYNMLQGIGNTFLEVAKLTSASKIQLEVTKLTSALQSGLEIAKYLNENSRKEINEFLYDAYEFGYENGVFESQKEMTYQLNRFKTLHTSFHPKQLEKYEIFLKYLNGVESLENMVEIKTEEDFDNEENSSFDELPYVLVENLEYEGKTPWQAFVKNGGNLEELITDYENFILENKDLDCADESISHPLLRFLMSQRTIESRTPIEWFEAHGYNIEEILSQYALERLNFYSENKFLQNEKPYNCLLHILYKKADYGLLNEIDKLEQYETLDDLCYSLKEEYPVIHQDIHYGDSDYGDFVYHNFIVYAE